MIQLFDAALGAVFVATRPFLMNGDKVSIDFDLTVGVVGAPATVEWFLEFTGADPNAAGTSWFREVAEEDIGGGVTHMPNVVRDFSGMAVGVHRKSAQFVRSHQFVRIQIRVTIGTVTRALITTPFGLAVISPAA